MSAVAKAVAHRLQVRHRDLAVPDAVRPGAPVTPSGAGRQWSGESAVVGRSDNQPAAGAVDDPWPAPPERVVAVASIAMVCSTMGYLTPEHHKCRGYVLSGGTCQCNCHEVTGDDARRSSSGSQRPLAVARSTPAQTR